MSLADISPDPIWAAGGLTSGLLWAAIWTHRRGRLKRVKETMKSVQSVLSIAACLGLLAVALPAKAQPNDSNVSFDAGALMRKKPGPGLPDVKAQPLAWPRLDPGAVLCRSEDDLSRLARRRSGQTVDGPVDCQIIRVATAIAILQRKGPGRTEVKASSDPSAEPGWTDAWLPQRAPSGATSAEPVHAAP
jgi:hypothetical protein